MPDAASSRDASSVARQLKHRFRHGGWAVRLRLWLRGLVASPADFARHVPGAGRVLDLACGSGELAIYLALESPARSVRGVDMDAERIAQARRAGAGIAGLTFDVGDLRDSRGERAAAVMLIDALHYFPEAEQAAVLRTCRGMLADGGVLVLRDVVREPGPAFWWNRFHELVMVGLGFTATRDLTLCFLTRGEIERHLSDAGFDIVQVSRVSRWVPYTDTLFVARCRKLP